MAPSPALPPGPRASLLLALRYLRDPLAFYHRCAARYGDRFTVPTPAGPLLVLGDPADVQALFALQPADFTRFSPETVTPLLGSRSLLVVSGEEHRRDRKLLSPLFAGERVRLLGRAVAAAMQRELLALPRRAQVKVKVKVTVQDLAQRVALETLVSALLGGDAAARAGGKQAVLACLSALDPKLMLLPALRRPLLGLGPYDRFVRCRDRLDALTFAEIARRRRELAGGQGAATAAADPDLLTLLLSLRDEQGQGLADREVRDQLLTLVLTGYETVGIAAAWVVYWIKRHPAIERRLRGELAALGPAPAAEALVAAPYLDAVCSESLRIYPVVPEVVRKLVRPLRLSDRDIPAGVAVAACIARVHHHPSVYDDAAAFRPERFLSSRRYAPWEYCPFAAGVRRCIGAALAQDELKILIGMLLSHCDIELRERAPVRPRMRHLAMGPPTGIRVTLTPRAP
jgi:cytochrome P450